MSGSSVGAAGGKAGRGEKLKLAVWGAGVVAVFLFHVGALLATATGVGGGAEIWSILLLIFAPLAVVGVIGGGVARAIRRDGRTDASNSEETV